MSTLRKFAVPLTIATFTIVGAYLVPDQTQSRGGPQHFAAFTKFADKSLTNWAPILDTEGEILVTRLEDAGYSGASTARTVDDLAGDTVRAQMQAFSVQTADGAALGGQGQGTEARD